MSLGPYSTKYKTTDKLKLNDKGEGCYIDVKDEYVKAVKKPDRIVGKQFQTNPPIVGQTGKYFTKYTYTPENYMEVRKYGATQPRESRKISFGSLDFSKRDEFLITLREGQWRELVDKEHYFVDKAILEKGDEKTNDAQSSSSLPNGLPPVEKPHLPHFQSAAPSHLYDIGNTEEGSTPMCIKCPRDTFFCPHRLLATNQEVTAQRPRKERLVSMDYGKHIDPAMLKKPEFAYTHTSKTFADSSRLNEHRLGSW